MPSVKQYQGFQYAGFEKGLNTHADSSRLEEDELAESLNFRLGPRGELQMRTGYTRFDVNLVDSIPWIFPWRSFAGVDHLIAVDLAGDIWEDTLDGTFTDSTHNVNPTFTLEDFGVGFASADKFAYVSSKTIGSVVSFDGTSWAQVAGIPSGKQLHFRHDRLFSINTLASPSRVFFSGFLTPEIFAVEDFIDFDPDDGFQINASVVFGDDLILFKDNAIWKLSGRQPASFATYRLDNHRGTVAPRCVAQLRGRLIFFDRDTGVWAFDGANFELLSQPINDFILDNQDYDAGWQASAYVGEDRYYLSVPQEGGGDKTFVYFADTGGWSEYNTGFSGAASYLNERYLGLNGADGIHFADDASNIVPPDVAPLVGRMRTGWLRVGGPGNKARIRRVEMTVKAQDDVDATINMYRDFDGVTVYKTRDFVGGGTPYAGASSDEERVIALDGWNNRVHAVQFEITTVETPFQLNDLTVFYTGGVDVRGER